MAETGWIVPGELPVGAHLRSLTEILNQPPSPEERRALRREAAEAEARRAQAQDTADDVAARGFMDRLNGRPSRDAADVLAEAAHDPFRDTEALTRRRAAIDALKPLGLDDVITGGQSGCVLDTNLGILEPVEDRPARSARAAMDRQYEFERSQREAEERNRFIARVKAQLDGRLRARGLAPRVSHRSAGPDAETVYRRACAEIGCAP